MTATLFFRQDVGFSRELRVRLDRTWLAENLTTLNAFTVDAAQKDANVVACFTAIEQFAEHLNAGAGRFLGVFDADDFNLFANDDNTALNTTGHNRAAA